MLSIFDRLYYARLRQDIVRWQKRKLIDGHTAETLLDQARPDREKDSAGFTAILIRLGIFLLLASAFSFVAANWDGMSKLFRLLLLTGLMWAVLGAGWWAGVKKHGTLKETLLVAAAGLFALNIVMIGQMYHIDRHFPDGYWLAGLGALVIAFLMRGEAALLLGWVLLGLWSASEIVVFDASPHWSYIPFWLPAGTMSPRATVRGLRPFLLGATRLFADFPFLDFADDFAFELDGRLSGATAFAERRFFDAAFFDDFCSDCGFFDVVFSCFMELSEGNWLVD